MYSGLSFEAATLCVLIFVALVWRLTTVPVARPWLVFHATLVPGLSAAMLRGLREFLGMFQVGDEFLVLHRLALFVRDAQQIGRMHGDQPAHAHQRRLMAAQFGDGD